MYSILLLLFSIGIWLALWFCNFLLKCKKSKIRAWIMALNTVAAIVFAAGILTPLNLWMMYFISLLLILIGFALTIAGRRRKQL